MDSCSLYIGGKYIQRPKIISFKIKVHVAVQNVSKIEQFSEKKPRFEPSIRAQKFIFQKLQAGFFSWTITEEKTSRNGA